MMDSRKAEGMALTINLVTPDNGEQYVIELSNATLTNIEGYQAEDADLTLTIPRLGLGQVIAGVKSLADQIAAGDAQADGDLRVLQQDNTWCMYCGYRPPQPERKPPEG